jgi:Cu-Zn family superoxide dismutase
MQFTRPTGLYKFMQPMKSWMKPSMSVRNSQMSMAKFPGTDVEIDAAGATFPMSAVCEVGELGKACDGSDTTSGVCGTVTFTQKDAETIEVKYKITGLAPGQHGFHIHEKADFSNGCASAGPHYNPFKGVHGGQDDIHPNRHVGDLGNIEAGADGVAEGTKEDKYIKLFGEYTVVGRSMMVHADEDDLGTGPLEGWPDVPPPPAPAQHTKTTGNAGGRIGCGIIESR